MTNKMFLIVQILIISYLTSKKLFTILCVSNSGLVGGEQRLVLQPMIKQEGKDPPIERQIKSNGGIPSVQDKVFPNKGSQKVIYVETVTLPQVVVGKPQMEIDFSKLASKSVHSVYIKSHRVPKKLVPGEILASIMSRRIEEKHLFDDIGKENVSNGNSLKTTYSDPSGSKIKYCDQIVYQNSLGKQSLGLSNFKKEKSVSYNPYPSVNTFFKIEKPNTVEENNYLYNLKNFATNRNVQNYNNYAINNLISANTSTNNQMTEICNLILWIKKIEDSGNFKKNSEPESVKKVKRQLFSLYKPENLKCSNIDSSVILKMAQSVNDIECRLPMKTVYVKSKIQVQPSYMKIPLPYKTKFIKGVKKPPQSVLSYENICKTLPADISFSKTSLITTYTRYVIDEVTEYPFVSFTTISEVETFPAEPFTTYLTINSNDKNDDLNDEDDLDYEISDEETDSGTENFRYFSYITTTVEKSFYPKKTKLITEKPRTHYITTTEEYIFTPKKTKVITERPKTHYMTITEEFTITPKRTRKILERPRTHYITTTEEFIITPKRTKIITEEPRTDYITTSEQICITPKIIKTIRERPKTHFKTTSEEYIFTPKKTKMLIEKPKTHYLTTTEECIITSYATKFIKEKPMTHFIKKTEEIMSTGFNISEVEEEPYTSFITESEEYMITPKTTRNIIEKPKTGYKTITEEITITDFKTKTIEITPKIHYKTIKEHKTFTSYKTDFLLEQPSTSYITKCEDSVITEYKNSEIMEQPSTSYITTREDSVITEYKNSEIEEKPSTSYITTCKESVITEYKNSEIEEKPSTSYITKCEESVITEYKNSEIEEKPSTSYITTCKESVITEYKNSEIEEKPSTSYITKCEESVITEYKNSEIEGQPSTSYITTCKESVITEYKNSEIEEKPSTSYITKCKESVLTGYKNSEVEEKSSTSYKKACKESVISENRNKNTELEQRKINFKGSKSNISVPNKDKITKIQPYIEYKTVTKKKTVTEYITKTNKTTNNGNHVTQLEEYPKDTADNKSIISKTVKLSEKYANYENDYDDIKENINTKSTNLNQNSQKNPKNEEFNKDNPTCQSSTSIIFQNYDTDIKMNQTEKGKIHLMDIAQMSISNVKTNDLVTKKHIITTTQSISSKINLGFKNQSSSSSFNTNINTKNSVLFNSNLEILNTMIKNEIFEREKMDKIIYNQNEELLRRQANMDNIIGRIDSLRKLEFEEIKKIIDPNVRLLKDKSDINDDVTIMNSSADASKLNKKNLCNGNICDEINYNENQTKHSYFVFLSNNHTQNTEKNVCSVTKGYDIIKTHTDENKQTCSSGNIQNKLDDNKSITHTFDCSIQIDKFSSTGTNSSSIVTNIQNIEDSINKTDTFSFNRNKEYGKIINDYNATIVDKTKNITSLTSSTSNNIKNTEVYANDLIMCSIMDLTPKEAKDVNFILSSTINEVKELKETSYEKINIPKTVLLNTIEVKNVKTINTNIEDKVNLKSESEKMNHTINFQNKPSLFSEVDDIPNQLNKNQAFKNQNSEKGFFEKLIDKGQEFLNLKKKGSNENYGISVHTILSVITSHLSTQSISKEVVIETVTVTVNKTIRGYEKELDKKHVLSKQMDKNTVLKNILDINEKFNLDRKIVDPNIINTKIHKKDIIESINKTESENNENFTNKKLYTGDLDYLKNHDLNVKTIKLDDSASDKISFDLPICKSTKSLNYTSNIYESESNAFNESKTESISLLINQTFSENCSEKKSNHVEPSDISDILKNSQVEMKFIKNLPYSKNFINSISELCSIVLAPNTFSNEYSIRNNICNNNENSIILSSTSVKEKISEMDEFNRNTPSSKIFQFAQNKEKTPIHINDLIKTSTDTISEYENNYQIPESQENISSVLLKLIKMLENEKDITKSGLNFNSQDNAPINYKSFLTMSSEIPKYISSLSIQNDKSISIDSANSSFVEKNIEDSSTNIQTSSKLEEINNNFYSSIKDHELNIIKSTSEKDISIFDFKENKSDHNKELFDQNENRNYTKQDKSPIDKKIVKTIRISSINNDGNECSTTKKQIDLDQIKILKYDINSKDNNDLNIQKDTINNADKKEIEHSKENNFLDMKNKNDTKTSLLDSKNKKIYEFKDYKIVNDHIKQDISKLNKKDSIDSVNKSLNMKKDVFNDKNQDVNNLITCLVNEEKSENIKNDINIQKNNDDIMVDNKPHKNICQCSSKNEELKTKNNENDKLENSLDVLIKLAKAQREKINDDDKILDEEKNSSRLNSVSSLIKKTITVIHTVIHKHPEPDSSDVKSLSTQTVIYSTHIES